MIGFFYTIGPVRFYIIRFPSSRTNPTYPRRLDLKILFSDLEKRVDRLIIHHLKK